MENKVSHTAGGAINPTRPDRYKVANGRRRPRHFFFALIALAVVALVSLSAGLWLAITAGTIKSELEAATLLVPQLKDNIANDKPQEAVATASKLRTHTLAARESAADPVWTLASAVPGVGQNFSAVAEIARTADDVVALGAVPLVKVFSSLNWESVIPGSKPADLAPLQNASPNVRSAAHAVEASAERLERIDPSLLLREVADPLARAKEELRSMTGALDASADASQIAPGMLGSDGPRNYLLMVQNNAEVRATGGIPGALAILTLNQGKLALGSQSSAGDVGVMSPVVQVDAEQEQIYSRRLGKFMQDVNLTPDFPTTAATAKAMWERKTGQHVDGVVSVDPVALGYLLQATGPIQASSPELLSLSSGKLPAELNSENVVRTLLSDVYTEIAEPQRQDAYFAGVAQTIFTALSSGKGDSKKLVESITRAADDDRILVWSERADEQSVIARYPLSGGVAGPSVSPAEFGIYFNDGTGAKMDYYVKRTVQMVQECTGNEYGAIKVRVTSTNTAPADAASSLPVYVTGGGSNGVPAGSVQTNITAYGPVQSNIETVFVAGKKTAFASFHHSGRPVGAITVRLAPGQSSTVDFTFDKIVQHTEPKLSVTPTVQPLTDVVLDTIPAKCAPDG